MLFPLCSFERIENYDANRKLVEWGHYLRGCNRPFGKQSFGLFFGGQLVSVAVSATLVRNSCFGYKRTESIELARLCTHPEHKDMTRVCLRLWRTVAREQWAEYWPAKFMCSYSRRGLHTGAIYRFDGWRHVCKTRASAVTAGSRHSTPGVIHSKDFWAYPVEPPC